MYIIVVIGFTANFIFWMFNVIKYVYPMQERSFLILGFYALVFILCSSHIVSLTMMSINPYTDPFIYDNEGEVTVVSFSEWLGSCSMLMLGWLVTATMF